MRGGYRKGQDQRAFHAAIVQGVHQDVPFKALADQLGCTASWLWVVIHRRLRFQWMLLSVEEQAAVRRMREKKNPEAG